MARLGEEVRTPGGTILDSKFHFHEGEGLFEVEGVKGTRQVSAAGPAYGTSAKRVELIDGTTPRHEARLNDCHFDLDCHSHSGESIDGLAFPPGAVEIEQHYYKGDVLEEVYGEVDTAEYDQTVIREIPVYEKEIEEIIVREQVVNTIVERVPCFNYIDNVIEVEHVVERPIYKEVPVKKTVIKQVHTPVREQRLIEKVRYVPVTEEVEVEKVIEIPGEVIVQPRHVVRDECIVTDKHFDKEVPVVISQVVNPVMKDTKKKVRVPAKILNPDLNTATVRVPKPVDLEFHQSKIETNFKYCALTAEEYNSAFFQLNSHLSAAHRQALRPNEHLHVDHHTGYPVLREKNLKFYRLPESVLEDLSGYNATEHVKSSSSSSTSQSVTSSSKSSSSSKKSSRSKSSSKASKSGASRSGSVKQVGHQYVAQAHHVAPVITSSH